VRLDNSSWCIDVSHDESLVNSVKESLKKVIDPELGENLMDLGMIRAVRVKKA
jgi:metal-sulfur cluster biosynthetic enzyme